MTFIPELRIEARASELWRRQGLEPNFDTERLLDVLQLNLLWDQLPADVLGALQAEEHLVILNQGRLAEFETMPGLERFTVAHKVGHAVLHADDSWVGVLPLMGGGRTWCRSNSVEPPEFQASRFASYLLVPRDRLLPVLPATPWRGWPLVYQLAETFGVTPTAMRVRLELGGHAHREEDGTPVSGPLPTPTSGQVSLPGILA